MKPPRRGGRGNVEPILKAIVRTAARLCDANYAHIYLVDGTRLRIAAKHGTLPRSLPIGESLPLTPGSVAGRAVVERRTVHVRDVKAAAKSRYKDAAALQRAVGVRTLLATPLLQGGRAVGALVVLRRTVRPFTARQITLLKTFAEQAAIALENARLSRELEGRNRELTESLEQQTATGEILRVISSSPTEIQPVLDAVVKNAARFCGAYDASILLREGGNFRAAAHHGPISAPPVLVPVVRGSVGGRSVLERRPVHVIDLLAESEEFPEASAFARAGGFRAMLSVPLLREGGATGVIQLRRQEAEPFADRQIALLQTFSDQAVIAIENVRLFTELEARNRDLTEALEQQTATSEILRVISRSQTDVQPVFDTIVRSAVKLCDGLFSALFQFDGKLIHQVAQHNFTPEGMEEVRRVYPARPSRALGSARAILERAIVHIPDVEADPEYQFPGLTRAVGLRSGLYVPMMREGAPVGVIMVARATPGLFSDSEVELLKTFADQAVIAIENVRLFTELEARNHDLTESLEQQTATSEILQVISSSPTDLQPVFDIIAESAVKLCGAEVGLVTRLEGEWVEVKAVYGTTVAGLDAIRRVYPMRPSRAAAGARAVHDCAIAHIPDVLAEKEYSVQEAAVTAGFRAALGVPMVREGRAIGSIAIGRAEAGEFSERQIKLLCTFADQALIAIENVRLFTELQARTQELTRSVDQLTALGEISQAVSSTLDVETVLQTIVSRAAQLAGADGCAIYEYDDASEAFHIRATHNLDPAVVGALRAAPLHKGEGTMGRAAETREPIQVADIAAPGVYQSHIRDTLLGAGYRALLSVPLLREGEVIGSLSLNRHAPGEFPREAIEVLKTFATQSALAIQNARLFREIADKSRQLESASRHKSEFLANMSHELRTPLNAIIGFSEVLNERMFGELNDKQAEYLKDIHASGTHLLSLINDILDLSKIEAGRMELELSDFSLPSAIDSALTLVRERATRRGITVRAAVDDNVGYMTGDERKIRQVLLNLLSNAVKFTPEGGRIEVKAVADDGSVDVSVIDTGVGIAPDDHEAVFEEFRQVGESAAKQEGTGLGLALCRKFVELHGGKIWVTSAVGTGSTFTFRLPVRQ